MLSIRLDKNLEMKLENFAKELKKSKSAIVKEALNKYLEAIEKDRIKKQKEAFEYFVKNPVNTGINDLKAVQKVKSENIR